MAQTTRPAPGDPYIPAGSQQETQNLIDAQDRARGMPSWAPWLIGGVAVGAVAYFFLRDRA